MRSMVASVSLLLLVPTVSLAQRVDAPGPGTRVRATPLARHQSYIMGTLLAQSGDSIVIQVAPADTARLALASLSVLEVSDGYERNFWTGAGYGFLIGAAGGAGIGAAAISEESWRGVGALFGAGVGGIAGLLIGGGIGSSRKSERWTRAPGWELDVSVGPAAAGFGVSLRF